MVYIFICFSCLIDKLVVVNFFINWFMLLVFCVKIKLLFCRVFVRIFVSLELLVMCNGFLFCWCKLWYKFLLLVFIIGFLFVEYIFNSNN